MLQLRWLKVAWDNEPGLLVLFIVLLCAMLGVILITAFEPVTMEQASTVSCKVVPPPRVDAESHPGVPPDNPLEHSPYFFLQHGGTTRVVLMLNESLQGNVTQVRDLKTNEELIIFDNEDTKWDRVTKEFAEAALHDEWKQ